MKILINQPLFLNEKGKRDNNEDAIYPLPGFGNPDDRLFIVCDGVGGAEKGEVASRLACDSLAQYFAKNNSESKEADIMNAFDFAQNQFDEFLQKEPDAIGMGTTMVLAHFHENGLTIAHCGDSRFYHFRKNRMLWQTFDHSMTNELVRQGIITADEAKQRPKTNRISRAIQGYSVHKSKPDIHFIKEIEPGDIFLLCTDGLWEVFSDAKLLDIISSNHTLIEKMNIFYQLCEANSLDNYSAYLIEILDVKKSDNDE